MQAPTSKIPEERELVVNPGTSMHMMSKKESSSEEMGTVKRSRNPAAVLAAGGGVHTHEEAQASVHDLSLCVTVQVLDNTFAVLSQGKLGEDHAFRRPRFAKTTDARMSGSAVKSHASTEMGKTSSARQTISYLLSFQGYLSILEAGRLQHRYHRNR